MAKGFHQFSTVPKANINRSVFNLSHRHLTTGDAGWMYPVFCEEAYPGDTWNVSMNSFARLATPINPVMDDFYITTHWFAVPMRILQKNFHKLHGAQESPGDSTDFLVPTIGTTAAADSVYDYFGVPTGVSVTINALPFRGHNLIYNHWIRDQNLQPPRAVNDDDGPDDAADYSLFRRGKRGDYFTTCLPFVSKGPEVLLPLGDKAPIGSSSNSGATVYVDNFNGTQFYLNAPPTGGTVSYSASGQPVNLEADLSQATGSTINELRQAFQIQRLQERDARSGTRLQEVILAHFNVQGSDARHQKPEFLGSSTSVMNVSQVPQTGETGTTPQGNLAAFVTGTINNHGFVKSFTEHCYIYGYVSLRSNVTYQQGLARKFTRSTRFDFYYPSLAHLGEQAVLNSEIMHTGTSTDDDVFGYQERFAELRFLPDRVSGKFRSNAAASLDPWHCAQEFGSVPALNGSFIQEDPPIDRVIAVPSEPHFIMDNYFKIKAVRPMPVYGVPGYIDRF